MRYLQALSASKNTSSESERIAATEALRNARIVLQKAQMASRVNQGNILRRKQLARRWGNWHEAS